ncbi:beta-phosphoglucomutase [Candidatus Termititenax dinenymphae]|uniref:Beta-phosphoglucomutase n=1 Tax=Candidatus Termititenax dinenymphae TaxID=2218523 RepID=A0A388TMN1_9BACT|nr:beta-phosphoglucomutase [Candidatus Termititenax dinenymphae]
MSKIKAVLFDMDGVIVDSMPYHFFAWYEAFKKYGITVSTQDIYEHEGEKWDTTLKYYLTSNNLPSDLPFMQKIFNYRQKLFHKIFKRHLMPGIPDLLHTLKNSGCLLGLVSGTPSGDVKRLISGQLYPLFDCIVGGDNVAHSKPHPEPYLTAAQKLGLKAKDCLVVENAPLGIASAKAAKMRCLAVTTSLPESYLKKAGADYICNIKDLRKAIFSL